AAAPRTPAAHSRSWTSQHSHLAKHHTRLWQTPGSACWRGCEFGLLAFELAFGAGDGHAFAGAEPEQVNFEFGEGGQDVEEHLAEGVGGVVDGAADATRAPRNQESGYSFAAGD